MAAHDPVWVTPLPPVESGISQYSRDILEALDGRWPMSVLPERGSSVRLPSGTSATTRRSAQTAAHHIIQIGNSGFHRYAYEIASHGGGMLVLHDVVLHHARLSDFVRRRKTRDYVRLMEALYGASGKRAAEQVLRGAQIDLGAYALSEDLIQNAAHVVVHSRHAESHVRSISPDASVQVLPMGVPLPALIDRQEARTHFGIPASTFVVCSITHVNPMKRLPIALRAFRQLVKQVPDALLVIAGSVSPGVNLRREIAYLGLQHNVRLLGYVDDSEARILARASDVAVNLRYPSTGETSASLLRLMGAGIPVIVTAFGSALEIDDNAVLRVPVDRLEEETLAEFLTWLAADQPAREMLGSHARSFVARRHSMEASIAGYRSAMKTAWNLDLPVVEIGDVNESAPILKGNQRIVEAPMAVLPIHSMVADRLTSLGLTKHDGTIQTVAQALHGLGFQLSGGEQSMASEANKEVDPELLKILACPVCKTHVQLVDDELVCDTCGRHYRIENGIPIMLVDETGGE